MKCVDRAGSVEGRRTTDDVSRSIEMRPHHRSNGASKAMKSWLLVLITLFLTTLTTPWDALAEPEGRGLRGRSQTVRSQPQSRPATARTEPRGRRDAPRAGNARRPSRRPHTEHARANKETRRHAHWRHGHKVRTLPTWHASFFFGGLSYYYSAGLFYRPAYPGFVVVAPPTGLVIGVLPADCSVVYLGGRSYYYTNGTYFVYDVTRGGYAVVPEPHQGW